MLLSECRKLQLESIGVSEVEDLVKAAVEKVELLKTKRAGTVKLISAEDEKRGLNSLCENKNKHTVVFPEPFKGNFGENVYKFKEEIVAAIRDSQVKKALLKYLRGDAKIRVGDHQPDLNTALKTLISFYELPSYFGKKKFTF